MYVLADSFTEDEEMEFDTPTRKRLLEAFRGFQTLFAGIQGVPEKLTSRSPHIWLMII